ncbi:MAG: 50S ribosomal protein L20 [bacterium]
MMRVKRGYVRARRRKRLLKRAKGFKGAKGKLIKSAREALLHSGQYALAGRRKKKGDFRSLWIARINAAVRPHGLSYSRFISGLKKADIRLNRKILSNMAILEKENFAKIVGIAKENLEKTA